MSDAASTRPFLDFRRSRLLFGVLAIAAVTNGLFGAWLVTAGPVDPVAHTARFLSFLVSPWMLATYVVTVVFLGFGAWRLSRRPEPVSERTVEQTLRRRAAQFAGVTAVAATSLTGIGYLYMRDVEANSYIDHAVEQQLVARIKAQHIGKWIVETTINAEIMANSIARMPIDRLPGDRDVGQVMGLLFAEALAGNPERTSVTLFAPDGTVLLHEGEGGGPDAETVSAVRGLISTPSAPRIVDLYTDPADPAKSRMAIVVPVATAAGAPPLGWLAIGLDPFRGVLDRFTAWPTASKTSEVMLVHRIGDEVSFIAPPPRLSPPPLPNAFRMPLSNQRLPAAQALSKGPGVHAGVDYSGVPVLTAFEKVNGLPWFVGAKTDESEYVGPLRDKARRLALVIGSGILLGIACMWVLYRGERSALLARERQADLEHEAMSRHFAALTRLARDIVLMMDPDGRIVEANEAAIAAYGYPVQELLGMSVNDLRPPEEREKFAAQWKASEATQDGILIETVHRRKDGSTFPVEISGRVIVVEGRNYRQGFVRDITQRRALERQVQRLSRVRSALQAATSVLLRSRDEGEVYERLCAVLVREAGYRMANVIMPNNDAAKSVRVAAVAGVDDGYLAQARISWGDGPRGQGPTGTALRTGIVQVNQDFLDNPKAALWRDEAMKRGYRSSISLPLKDGETVFAVLTLYATEPDAFDDDEVALLTTLSADLAFAATSARQRRAA